MNKRYKKNWVTVALVVITCILLLGITGPIELGGVSVSGTGLLSFSSSIMPASARIASAQEVEALTRRGGPPIVGISFDNGVFIDCSGGYPDYQLVAQDMDSLLQSLTIQQAEDIVNSLLASHFEVWTDIKDFSRDDPVRQDPPVLLGNERIEAIGNKDYLVTIVCYPAIHFFSLVPLEYTTRINGLDLGPVTGDWWL